MKKKELTKEIKIKERVLLLVNSKLKIFDKYESNSFLNFNKDKSIILNENNNGNILEFTKLNEEINNFTKELNEIEKQIIDIENYIKDKKMIINNIKMELIKTNELNSKSYNIKIISDLLNELRDNNSNELKSNFSLLSKKEEKLISVIFISFDENIHYSIICKNIVNFQK